MPGRVWTRDKLITTIKQLSDEGVDLSPTSIQKTHGALFSSARSRSHFGTWREAIEAAGIDYEGVKRIKQRWSHEDILEQLRMHHAAGEDLLDPQFKLKHRGLYLAACAHRYFGSWRRAVQAAGLDHETMREKRIWTRARILRCISDLAKDGKPLGWAYVEQHCPGIYRAARRKENFNSWHEALLAAGATPATNARGRRPNVVRERLAREAAESTTSEQTATGTAAPKVAKKPAKSAKR